MDVRTSIPAYCIPKNSLLPTGIIFSACTTLGITLLPCIRRGFRVVCVGIDFQLQWLPRAPLEASAVYVFSATVSTDTTVSLF